jgi:type I restriction enzyme, S subunit
MIFESVTIDDICELVRGSSPRPQGDPRFFGGAVPRLMVSDMTRDGMYVTPSIDSLTEEGAKQSRPMKAGEVVMVVSGLVGLPSILRIDACIHDGLVGFRNLDNSVLPEFLYYWLLSSQEKNRSQTAGAIWQNLTTDQIKEWRIPLPPLTEQKQIVSLLARADRLRQLRRNAQDLGDTLLQSVFLEMFGDPASNEKEWNVLELGEVVQFISGHGFKFSEYSSNGVRLLQIANVSFQEIIWDNLSYLPPEYMASHSNLLLQEGDLLMALNRPILGDRVKFAFLKSRDAPAILYQRVGKLVPDKNRINSHYLYGFMLTRYFYNELKNRLAGSDQPYINPTELVKMKFLLPPLSLQEEFAGVVARVEGLRARMSEAERQVEGLFEALLAESFGK